MRIIITGGLGQLGKALQSVLSEHTLTIVDLPETDITDRKGLEQIFRQVEPDVVIHCAAYTDVDGCARDPELAYRINGFGTQNVAVACRVCGATMLHVSTNEVFDGTYSDGYDEWMPPNPINHYGRSKTFAEFHVRSIMDRYYIVRTAWLYAPGGRNFIHAILDRAHNDGYLKVVTDEIGNPTYVMDLAVAIGQLLSTGQYGIYHLVNEEACSRWEFANEILKLANLNAVANTPILSRDYHRPSTPPLYGSLKNNVGAALGIELRPWRDALAEYMANFT